MGLPLISAMMLLSPPRYSKHKLRKLYITKAIFFIKMKLISSYIRNQTLTLICVAYSIEIHVKVIMMNK